METLLQTVHGKTSLGEGELLAHDDWAFDVNALDSSENAQKQVESGRLPTAMPSLEEQGITLASNTPTTSLSPLNHFRGNTGLLGQSGLLHEPILAASSWEGSLPPDITSHSSFQELPSKQVALELVDVAFNNFNCFYPLFDQHEFLRTFHANYSRSSPRNPAWWACINVVLALAHRFRAMHTLEVAYENAQACRYIHNALAVIAELNMLRQSLPAVQALVGMVIILRGTPNSHVCSVLIAAAIRLAQALGLHRKTRDSDLTELQVTQRRRVFWIAYCLDKDISLRTGQPAAQDDDDMDAELPSGIAPEVPLSGSGFYTTNLFHASIGLAVIQGQIYKKLCSVQAMRQSSTQKAAVAQEFNAILSYWRSSVPIDFEDGQFRSSQANMATELLHAMSLHLTYVNCLTIIHHHTSPSWGTDSPAYQGQVQNLSLQNTNNNCIMEFRKAVRLVQMAPQGNYGCVWYATRHGHGHSPHFTWPYLFCRAKRFKVVVAEWQTPPPVFVRQRLGTPL